MWRGVITLFSLITLVVTVALNKIGTRGLTPQIAQAPQNPEVLSLEEDASPISTPLVTTKPTSAPTKTPQKTVNPTPQMQVNNNFVYPNSRIISQTQGNIKLMTMDTTDKVLKWYQDKLSSLGFNSQSLSRTNTNGQELVSIAAASASSAIEIKMNRNTPNAELTIEINIK